MGFRLECSTGHPDAEHSCAVHVLPHAPVWMVVGVRLDGGGGRTRGGDGRAEGGGGEAYPTRGGAAVEHLRVEHDAR